MGSDPAQEKSISPRVFELPDEAALHDRTRVPPEKLGRYLSMSGQKLRQEVAVINSILMRFARAVADTATEPRAADSFLKALDLRFISMDHDWRRIFSEIREQSAADDSYRQTVLLKYLQFLSFRKRLFEYVYARKSGFEETTTFNADDMISDGEQIWVRIALGDAVKAFPSKNEAVDIRLAGYQVRLVGGFKPGIINEDGDFTRLAKGPSIIGRHPESDVVIPAGSGAVSRAHLLIERTADNTFVLTDLSSGGTFISSNCLNLTALGQNS